MRRAKNWVLQTKDNPGIEFFPCFPLSLLSFFLSFFFLFLLPSLFSLDPPPSSFSVHCQPRTPAVPSSEKVPITSSDSHRLGSVGIHGKSCDSLASRTREAPHRPSIRLSRGSAPLHLVPPPSLLPARFQLSSSFSPTQLGHEPSATQACAKLGSGA